MELAALEHLKKTPRFIIGEMVVTTLEFHFEWIFFALVSYNNKNKSFGGFEFPPGPNTDFEVSCPYAS